MPSRIILTLSKNPNKTHRKGHRKHHTQNHNYHREHDHNHTHEQSKKDVTKLNYEMFHNFRYNEQSWVNKYNKNQIDSRIDLALGLIINNVLNALGVTSETKEKEIFERIINEPNLPLNLNSKGWVTRSSIENSVNYMVNKIKLAEIKEQFQDKKQINQQEKLDIFQNNFSRKVLNLLPDLLVGQKGNLRHGFVDKSVQAASLKICTLLVILDNIYYGWENNTQNETEDRANRSFEFILMAIIVMVVMSLLTYLAEKKAANRKEDLESLKNDYEKTMKEVKHIRATINSTEAVVKEINKQKVSYFYDTKINKEEVQQIIVKICDRKTRDEVLDRFNQVFERAGEDTIYLSTLQKYIPSILKGDYDKHDKLESKLDDIKSNFENLLKLTKSEKDPANIILASKDFAFGYPKHISNKCTDSFFGIRFFEQKSTRDRFLLRECEENNELDQHYDYSFKD